MNTSANNVCFLLHDAGQVLRSLLAYPKGPEHIIFLSASVTKSKQTLYKLRRNLQDRIASMQLPYRLKFYQGPGLVCYWEAIEGMEMQKEWFDKNAAEGLYPEVAKTPEKETQ